MTQTHPAATGETVAEPRWRDFERWLTRKKVMLGALAIVAGQVALSSYVGSRSYFQQDDFAIGGLTAHSFSFHLMFMNYGGHLMPAVFALAWVLIHTGAPYDWGLWDGLLVGVQALTVLALLRVLRNLFGDRPAVLVPLGVFAFTPLSIAALGWWADSVQTMPMQLALVLALDQHIRYVRDGRLRNAVYATGWMLFGYAFSEKSVAIPLLLLAVTAAYLMPASTGQPGSGRAALRGTLRKHLAGWALYSAALIAEIVAYAASTRTGPSNLKVPYASSAVDFGWDLIKNTFITGALGGPWRWTQVPGSAITWSLSAVASPPPALVYGSWVVAGLIVVASLWYRDRAWRAWLILLGWLIVVDVLPIALGRLVAFGLIISTQTMYVTDAAPVLAICLGLAFLPLRGERGGYRATLPRGGRRTAALAAVAAVTAGFLAGAVTSDHAYRTRINPSNGREYLATTAKALSLVPKDAVIYPGQIPNQLAWAMFGAPTEIQNALAPLIVDVSSERFTFTARPSGMTNSFYLFNALGQLQPATVAGPHTTPQSSFKRCLLPPSGVQLPLSGNVFALPLVMQVNYLAADPVTLSISFGGQQYTLNLPSSTLASAYVPVEGPGNSVTITPLTPDARVCLGAITVGNVQPDPTHPPVPAYPLRG